jgi:hypothetical protein
MRWNKAFAAVLSLALMAGVVGMSALAEETVGTVPCQLSSWSGDGAMIDESTLGDAAADALRYVSGADVAIVCGGDISDNALRPGQTTREEINDAFTEDREIAVCTVTVEQFCHIVEAGISHIQVDYDTGALTEDSAFAGYPQVAGFQFKFDALAEVDQRIMSLTLDDGTKLDPEDDQTTITLAAPEYILDGNDGFPVVERYTPLNMTYSDAFAVYVASGEMTTNYTRVSRIHMVDVSSKTIISETPVAAVAVIIACCALYGLITKKRRKDVGDFRWDEREYDPNDKPLM